MKYLVWSCWASFWACLCIHFGSLDWWNTSFFIFVLFTMILPSAVVLYCFLLEYYPQQNGKNYRFKLYVIENLLLKKGE